MQGMEGKQEMMKYPEASNCGKPVSSLLGLRGLTDCNSECVVMVTEGHLRAVTLSRQMAATEGIHGSKYSYLAFLLTSNLLLVVHIS